MTETAIAQAMVFSAMYFFMDKPLPAIMLFVWAITERPPKDGYGLGGNYLDTGRHFEKSGEKPLSCFRKERKALDKGGGYGKNKDITGYIDND